jgi:phage shock protein PspC (stress-responsive transcriptional regulator)
METLKRKLSSRKLWAAVVGVVTGLAMFFGVDGGTVTKVVGGVTTLLPLIAYIFSEGHVDAVSAKAAAESVQQLVETIEMEDDQAEKTKEARFDSYE